jgi:hypothetical protein
VYYNDEMKNPEWHYQMIAESECASHRNLYNERIWEMGVGDEDNPERFIGMILYCKGVNPEDNKLGVMLSYDRKKNEVKIEENYMYEYIFKLSECRFP